MMTALANPLSENGNYATRKCGVSSSIWSHPRQNLQARALLSIGAQTVGKDQCHTGPDGLVMCMVASGENYFFIVTF